MKRKNLWLVLAVILAVSLVGCGSDDFSSDTRLSDSETNSVESGSVEDSEEASSESDSEDGGESSLLKSAIVTDGEHNVSGEIFIYSDNTLVIENFTYDGKAPDTYIALGHHDGGKFVLGEVVSEIIVDAYSGEEYSIELPSNLDIADYDAVSVYCLAFGENFGSADLK